MKKSTIVFTVIGFLCIIIGGFTALLTFSDAKEAVITEEKKNFPVSGDTLTLDISSNIYYQLTAGDSDDVTVRSQYVNLDNRKLTIDSGKVTGGNLISIEDKSKEKDSITGDILDDTLVGGQHIYIQIPTSVKHLILNTTSGNIYDLSLDELTLSSKSSSNIELSNLVAKKITTENKKARFSLNNSAVENIHSTASEASIYIHDTKVNETTVEANSLDFSYHNVTCPKTTIKSNKGNVYLGESSGDVDLSGDSVSLTLSLPLKGNISANLERGDISGDFDSYPTDTYIKGSVETGNGDIFGKSSYGEKNATYTWDLKTTLGNISLSNYNDWEETNDEEGTDRMPEKMENMDGMDHMNRVTDDTSEKSTIESVTESTASSTVTTD